MQGEEFYLKYFPDLDRGKLEKLLEFKERFLSWNEKMNLISRKDIAFFELNHVLHSLSIARIFKFHPGHQILDFGTGGGFPGIPLAIFFPRTAVTMVDSIGKKCRAVQDIIKGLELENASVLNCRVEDIDAKFDFITCRAVGRLNLILPWVENKLRPSDRPEFPNGFIFLKGGDLTSELAEIRIPYRVYHISDFFNDEFFKSKEIVYLSKHLKAL